MKLVFLVFLFCFGQNPKWQCHVLNCAPKPKFPCLRLDFGYLRMWLYLALGPVGWKPKVLGMALIKSHCFESKIRTHAEKIPHEDTGERWPFAS